MTKETKQKIDRKINSYNNAIQKNNRALAKIILKKFPEIIGEVILSETSLAIVIDVLLEIPPAIVIDVLLEIPPAIIAKVLSKSPAILEIALSLSPNIIFSLADVGDDNVLINIISIPNTDKDLVNCKRNNLTLLQLAVIRENVVLAKMILQHFPDTIDQLVEMQTKKILNISTIIERLLAIGIDLNNIRTKDNKTLFEILHQIDLRNFALKVLKTGFPQTRNDIDIAILDFVSLHINDLYNRKLLNAAVTGGKIELARAILKEFPQMTMYELVKSENYDITAQILDNKTLSNISDIKTFLEEIIKANNHKLFSLVLKNIRMSNKGCISLSTLAIENGNIKILNIILDKILEVYKDDEEIYKYIIEEISEVYETHKDKLIAEIQDLDESNNSHIQNTINIVASFNNNIPIPSQSIWQILYGFFTTGGLPKGKLPNNIEKINFER